jgi:5,10-methylenetetrahydromethanopterin reductase
VEAGLLLGPTSDIRRFAESARQAEDLGYATAWVPDQGFHRDPVVALALAAEKTSRLQLGLGVANAYTRHPATLARAAGTLAELSGGRFILGLGAGERALRDRVGAARAAFLPTIQPTFEAIRDLLRGCSVTATTRLFELRDAKLDFTVEHPVPLYLATRDANGLRAAGEIADGVILGDICDPAGVKRQIADIRAGARAAGREPGGIRVVSWIITIVTHDRAAVLQRLRPILARTLITMVPSALEVLGVTPDTVQVLRDALAGLRPTLEQALRDDLIENLAIIGDEAYCIRRIRSLQDAGATQIAMRMPMDLARVLDYDANLRLFAENVLPHLAV